MTSSFSQPVTRPERGEIWWSSPSVAGPASYEGCDRMLFVVLDSEEAVDRSWFDVAPIWPDADLANELDLVLGADDTTLEWPARVQLRRQLILAWEQLEEKMGEVKAHGLELIDAAARGELGLESFGIPYESEHDWRIAADRWAAGVVAQLQGPYFAALEAAGDAIERAGEEAPEELADVVSLLAERARRAREEDHEFALAADDRAQKDVLEISVGQPPLLGYLWPNAQRDALELHLERVAGAWWKSVELLVGLKDGRTISSPPFTPKDGACVRLGEGETILLRHIDESRISIRVVGG